MTRPERDIRDILGINEKKPDPPVHLHWIENVARNEKCPCGSGKKFKRCHGASHWRTLLLYLEHPDRWG